MTPARVRFAPSPTGALHLGSALAALANRAFANLGGGQLLLRIDDTDAERSKLQAVDDLIELLQWLGIGWDEGPRFQSKRDDDYQQRLDKLLADGNAYHCFCSAERLAELGEQQRAAGRPPRYDRSCRELSSGEVERRFNLAERAVVRLRVPEAEFSFEDAVRGSVPAPIGSFDDFVLRRSDESFTYLFASAIDDIEFGITHVLRGEDHLPNTPRQLAIFRALDAPEPQFAHLPLLLVEGGARKLSKRDPLGTLDDLRAQGILASTVRRYLAELLGQGAVDVLDDEAAGFELGQVPASSPHVSLDRLHSLARADLAAMPRDELLGRLSAAGTVLEPGTLPLFDEMRGQATTVVDLQQQLAQVLTAPTGDVPADDAVGALEQLLEVTGDENIEHYERLVKELRAWGKGQGRSVPDTLQPARLALTGSDHGPPLPLVLYAVGRQQALARVRRGSTAGSQPISDSTAPPTDTGAPGE